MQHRATALGHVLLAAAAALAVGCGSSAFEEPPDGGAAQKDGAAPARDGESTGQDGQPVACRAPLTSCGGACVDPQSSAEHCGGCDQACPGGQLCAAGSCTSAPDDCTTAASGCPEGYYCDLTDSKCHAGCGGDDQCGQDASCDLTTHQCQCDVGFHRCGGVCVDSGSVDHCGTSCTPCPEDPFGATSCVAGKCQLSCKAGHKMCGGKCAPCPTAAEVSHSGCQADTCVATACAVGSFLCSSGCCSWKQEVVASGVSPKWVGLALTGTDTPVVLFTQPSSSVGAARLGGSWTTKTLTEGTSVPVSAIGRGRGGAVHVSVMASGLSGQSLYAWTGTWKGSWTPWHTSQKIFHETWLMDVAGNGQDHTCRVISEHSTTPEYNTVYYGCVGSTSEDWIDKSNRQEIGKWGGFSEVALELDSANRPHVVYYKQGSELLTYAYKDASGWHEETVVNSKLGQQRVSLALTVKGEPAIAVGVSGQLRLYRRTGSNSWTHEVAQASAGWFEWPVLRFTGAGDPVISTSGMGRNLVVSRSGGGSWTHLEVGPWELHGMDLDSKGNVHLAVSDAAKGQVLYIH